MNDYVGVIYVLTNPSFPEYVKIGYADDVEKRLSQLNQSECTPFAFRIYATLNVPSRLADKNIHKLIDKFMSEVRSREKINGKIRVREFFALSPKEAYELLSLISSIYDEAPSLYTKSNDEITDTKIAIEYNNIAERRSNFSFYNCGITKGETLIFVNDKSITCTVVDDKHVKYDDKTTSLSALAKKLLAVPYSIQGTLYFLYNGEILSALRKRLEDEKTYSQSNSISENGTTNIRPNDNNILYFTMPQYNAKCMHNDGVFTLLQGSHISPSLSKSCPAHVGKSREEHSKNISTEFIITKDIDFHTSSAAACFVAGMSLSGNKYWKTRDGVLLKDIVKQN